MRQLRSEGWIHDIARRAVGSFLTRGCLWINWEEGFKVGQIKTKLKCGSDHLTDPVFSVMTLLIINVENGGRANVIVAFLIHIRKEY